MKHETTIVLSLVAALSLVGVLMVYSASAVGGDAVGMLHRELFFVLIGLVFMTLSARFDYHRWNDRWIYRSVTGLALALLLIVLVPGIGVKVDGARRWMQIGGFRFQPSEFAKFALILLLAVKLNENREYAKRLFRGFLPPVGIACVFAGLVLAERDLGIPAMMIGTAGAMMFLGGVRWQFLLLSVAPGAAGLFALVWFAPHRLRRLFAFINPWDYRDDAGWQLIQSFAAFARGSLLGRGVGAGEQKHGYLPAAHTDFIFPVIGEELGLVGTLAIVIVFACLARTAYRIAANAPDRFGALLASGITTMFTMQAVFIMMVTTGLLPTKGLPLPFISYGGTALVMQLTLIGILINVGLQARAPEPTPLLVHAV